MFTSSILGTDGPASIQAPHSCGLWMTLAASPDLKARLFVLATSQAPLQAVRVAMLNNECEGLAASLGALPDPVIKVLASMDRTADWDVVIGARPDLCGMLQSSVLQACEALKDPALDSALMSYREALSHSSLAP